MPRSLPRLAVILCVTGVFVVARTHRADPTAPPATRQLVDHESPAWSAALLELAFDAASVMPIDPHRKTRSRLQASVVAAWLDADRPERAARAIDGIADWRRGLALADLALWFARHDAGDEARTALERATRVADGLERDPTEQAWRRDRIRAAVAETWLALGDIEPARAAAKGIAESEIGRVDAAHAKVLADSEFEATFAALRTVILNGSLDRARGALSACVKLFARFHDDVARRDRVARVVRGESSRVPPQARIELLIAMADAAATHGDVGGAREWVDAARAVVDGEHWLAGDFVARLAEVAAARARAGGDRDGARRELAAALARFDAERSRIVDVERAAALRPIAAAYASIGERDVALAIHRSAADDGATNPNARPRAEDLVATCLSIVRAGFEPDAELVARLRAIREGLTHPW